MMPAPAQIDYDDLLQQSELATGLNDFGGADVFESLQVLTCALNEEARLTPAGAAGKRGALIRALSNRLKLVRVLRDNPAIEAETITTPLVIVGLPRSGTTKLHRMIAADPHMQKLPLWKILNPLPVAEQIPGQRDRRLDIAEAFEAAMRETQPKLHAAHPMLAMEPDEDVFALEITARGYLNCSGFRTPSYKAWLDQQPFQEWYRWLKRLLQVAQFFDGAAGRPWVLKAPQHLGFLPLLFERFPDAVIVHCHRDPKVCVASFAGMLLAARKSTSYDVDDAEVGQYAVRFYEVLMQRYLHDRAVLEGKHRFIDIRYRDIAEHGVATVQSIYAGAGLSLDKAACETLRQWEIANVQHGNSGHRYSLADGKLTEQEVSQAFAKYIDKYSVFF